MKYEFDFDDDVINSARSQWCTSFLDFIVVTYIRL